MLQKALSTPHQPGRLFNSKAIGPIPRRSEQTLSLHWSTKAPCARTQSFGRCENKNLPLSVPRAPEPRLIVCSTTFVPPQNTHEQSDKALLSCATRRVRNEARTKLWGTTAASRSCAMCGTPERSQGRASDHKPRTSFASDENGDSGRVPDARVE
ncbi:hypothetical protein MTO96_018468 [Rhipicephalus appendiculatus]